MHTVVQIHAHRGSDPCTPWFRSMHTVVQIHAHRGSDPCTLWFRSMHTVVQIHAHRGLGLMHAAVGCLLGELKLTMHVHRIYTGILAIGRALIFVQIE